ncbi:hypothetical protein AVEN_250711-1, partial [Araneus ventricosus]
MGTKAKSFKRIAFDISYLLYLTIWDSANAPSNPPKCNRGPLLGSLLLDQGFPGT